MQDLWGGRAAIRRSRNRKAPLWRIAKWGVLTALVAAVCGVLVWAGDISHADAAAVRLAALQMKDQAGSSLSRRVSQLWAGPAVVRSVTIAGPALVADGESEATVQIAPGEAGDGYLILSSPGGSFDPAQIRLSGKAGETVTAAFRSGWRPGLHGITVQLCGTDNSTSGPVPRADCQVQMTVPVQIEPPPGQWAQTAPLLQQAGARRAEADRIDRAIAELDRRLKPLQEKAAAARAEAESRRVDLKRLQEAVVQPPSLQPQAQVAAEVTAEAATEAATEVTAAVAPAAALTAQAAEALRHGADRVERLTDLLVAGTGASKSAVDQALIQLPLDPRTLAQHLRAAADEIEQARESGSVRTAAERLRVAVGDPIGAVRRELDDQTRPLEAASAALSTQLEAQKADRDRYRAERDRLLTEAGGEADRYRQSCHSLLGVSLCTDLGAWSAYVRGVAEANAVGASAAALGISIDANAQRLAETEKALVLLRAIAAGVDGPASLASAQVAALSSLSEVWGDAAKEQQFVQSLAQAAELEALRLERSAQELQTQAVPVLAERTQLVEQRKALIAEATRLEAEALSPGSGT